MEIGAHGFSGGGASRCSVEVNAQNGSLEGAMQWLRATSVYSGVQYMYVCNSHTTGGHKHCYGMNMRALIDVGRSTPRTCMCCKL